MIVQSTRSKFFTSSTCRFSFLIVCFVTYRGQVRSLNTTIEANKLENIRIALHYWCVALLLSCILNYLLLSVKPMKKRTYKVFLSCLTQNTLQDFSVTEQKFTISHYQ